MDIIARTAILCSYVTVAMAQNELPITTVNDPFGAPAAGGVGEPLPLPATKQPPPPPGSFRCYAGLSQANANLPAHVKAGPGKLTLFADFTHPEKRGIPLYLINRTDKKIRFESQDGDVYIKLERQTSGGRWERAQAHQHSDCGNSYGRELLLPGMHFRMHGYQPDHGEPAKVRYTSYGSEPCVSNEGKGFYSLVETTAVEDDVLTRRSIPAVIRDGFNPETPFNEPKIYTQITLLKMAELLGHSPIIRSRASHWLKTLEARKSLTAEQKLALPIVRKTLDHDWGACPGHGPLLQLCLAALKEEKTSKPEFGSLAQDPELAWQVIRDLAWIEFHHYANLHDVPQTDDRLWKEAMTLAAAQVLKAPANTADYMTGLFRVPTLVNDFLPDEALEPLLAADSYELPKLAANALAHRSQWERLAELGFKLDAKTQLIILSALAQGPYYDNNYGLYEVGGLRVGPDSGDMEKSFWLHVIEEQPLSAAWTLSLLVSGDDRNPFRSDLFETMRTYWRKMAEQSDSADKDFALENPDANYRVGLEFFADLREPQDLPLLRSLLHHRGYIEQKVLINDKPHTKRVFVLRGAAAEALQKRGEKMPADLELEVDVVPAIEKEAP